MYSMQYAHINSILHMIHLGRGMVCSSGHTVFTCQLLYIRAHFQLGFLPSKQEAARSFPHSLEQPFSSFPPQPAPPPPTHRPQLGLSNTPAGKRGEHWWRGGVEERRETESQDLAFLLAGSLEIHILLHPTSFIKYFSLREVQLEATPNKLANIPHPDAGYQVRKDDSKVNTVQRINRQSLGEIHSTTVKTARASLPPNLHSVCESETGALDALFLCMHVHVCVCKKQIAKSGKQPRT